MWSSWHGAFSAFVPLTMWPGLAVFGSIWTTVALSAERCLSLTGVLKESVASSWRPAATVMAAILGVGIIVNLPQVNK